MKVWGKTYKNQRVFGQVVRDIGLVRPADMASFEGVLHELCQELDLSRPVLLSSHFSDFQKFSRVVFRPSDFMEKVSFERFEVELLPEKKKEKVVSYSFD